MVKHWRSDHNHTMFGFGEPTEQPEEKHCRLCEHYGLLLWQARGTKQTTSQATYCEKYKIVTGLPERGCGSWVRAYGLDE